MTTQAIVASPAKTKNDLYADLIAEGVKRGFAVIPEFRVPVTSAKGRARQKNIDLVWATHKHACNHGALIPCNNLCHWDVIAAIEIEGCNVALARIEQHRRDFAWLRRNGAPNLIGAVALYTGAHDRKWLVRQDRATMQVINRQSLSVTTSPFHVVT